MRKRKLYLSELINKHINLTYKYVVSDYYDAMTKDELKQTNFMDCEVDEWHISELFKIIVIKLK